MITCSEEKNAGSDNREDDEARILVTSIKMKDEDAPVNLAHPMTTFENPVYGTMGPRPSTEFP